MNKIILMGNLTRDPEVRYSQGAEPIAIANFTLAVNRRIKREDGQDCDFFNCTAFRKQAEFIEKYFRKGSRMLLTGRVENNNYTNKNGEKVYSIQIMTEEVEFGSTKTESGESRPSADEDFTNLPDDATDVPFL